MVQHWEIQMQSYQAKSNTAELNRQQDIERKKQQSKPPEKPGGLTKDYTPLENIKGIDTKIARYTNI